MKKQDEGISPGFVANHPQYARVPSYLKILLIISDVWKNKIKKNSVVFSWNYTECWKSHLI